MKHIRTIIGLLLSVVLVSPAVTYSQSQTFYEESWTATKYRFAQITIPNPATYISGQDAGRVQLFYDATIPPYVSEELCLGVAEWQVTWRYGSESATEVWTAVPKNPLNQAEVAEFWDSTAINYAVKSLYHMEYDLHPRYDRQVHVDYGFSEICNNYSGEWLDQTWRYVRTFDGVDTNVNQERDVFYVTPLGQYAMLAQQGHYTDADWSTGLEGYTLYPFNLKSTPKKWRVTTIFR